MAYRVLVVDDDHHIRDVICFALGKAGMTSIAVGDGAEAVRLAEREAPDLVVLDIGLPEMDGLEVCRRLRRAGDVPILFLTARGDEIDRVLGLELGGDDYVVKPFSPRELVARIGAILKRTGGRVAPSPEEVDAAVRHGPLTIDPVGFKVLYGAHEIGLTAIEFTILRTLAERPGAVLSRDRIMTAAYAPNVYVSDRTIDSHVRNIRAKFAAAGCEIVIETVHGVGFRMGALA